MFVCVIIKDEICIEIFHKSDSKQFCQIDNSSFTKLLSYEVIIGQSIKYVHDLFFHFIPLQNYNMEQWLT